MAEEFKFTVLGPDEEQKFQQFILNHPWYSEFKEEFGQEPQIDGGDYDYRGAWEARGEEMFAKNPMDRKWHGYSKTPGGSWLKAPEHTTRWKEDFYQMFREDPDKYSLDKDRAGRLMRWMEDIR